MAALNTLRTKGGVFLSVVIAFSLLAFLVGDGSFFGGNKEIIVGNVNDQEIKGITFNETVDKLTFVTQFTTGRSSLTAEETEKLNNEAWQQFIAKSIFEQGNVSLGMAIGDEELKDMISGKYISSLLSSVFSNGLGGIDHKMLKNFISNIDTDESGKYSRFWSYMEDEMEKERIMDKYIKLVSEGVYVTDLETEVGLGEENNTYNISYVLKSISSIPDSSIVVNDAELKAYYEKHIERFKRDPFRKVEYISIDITPSDEDIIQAQEYFTNLVSEFKTTDNVIQFVNINSEDRFENRYFSKSAIPANFQEYAFGTNTDEVFVSEMIGDKYSAVKVVDSKILPDSITFKAVAVPANANIDSLVNVIKSTEEGILNIANTYKLSDLASLDPMTVNTSNLTEEPIINAKKGEVVRITSGEYVTLIQILNTTAPVNKVKLAQLTYSVIPSNRTEQLAYSKATEFVERVNEKGASFDDVVNDKALTKRIASIGRQDRMINGIKDTREIIRWAHTSKINDISSVISIGNVNYVVRLVDIFEGGYLPFDMVKEDLKPEFISKLKEDVLAKEMSEQSDLETLASKLGTSVAVADDVSFTTFFIQGIGMAPKVIGAVSVSSPDVVSKPVSTGTDMVVFKLNSKNYVEVADFEMERVLIETNYLTQLQDRILYSLVSLSKIEDNRIIYF